MSGKKIPHLHRRGNVFYFRAAIPKKWHTIIKAFEVKYSLNTENRQLANLRCRFMSNAFEIFFRDENLAKIPLERINEAARAYLLQRLNKALELVIDIPTDMCLDIDDEIAGALQNKAALQKALKIGKFDEYVTSDAEEVWKNTFSEKIDLDQFNYLCRLITYAKMHSSNYLATELSGGSYDGAQSDHIFRGIMPSEIYNPFEIEENVTSKNQTITSVIAHYVKVKNSLWVPRSKADHLRSLNLVTSIIGLERKMGDIVTSDIQQIRDTLINLPKHVLRSDTPLDKAYINQTSSKEEHAKLSYQTQDKYFSMIRSFFIWAVDEEYIAQMPGPKIKLAANIKQDPKDLRNSYTQHQLIKIFSSPLYCGSKSASRRSKVGSYFAKDSYFWVPLVALYTGMRLGEIIQLGVEDLKQEEHVDYFDICIDIDSNKTLKTATSIRRVPIHHKLISLGFMVYYEQQKLNKKERIFDDIKPTAAGEYSGVFSKWWSNYGRTTGFYSPKAVFHSFRHTFIDALREADIDENMSRILVGHVDSKPGDAHRNYGSKVNIKKLQAAIQKIDYPFLEATLQKITP